jgi:3-deoxy-D-manno-octulosonic-acid transferase
MSFLYDVYRALTSGVFLTCLPPFWLYTQLSGRYRKGFGERLGFLLGTVHQKRAGSPRIWIHAASLGEVKVARAVAGHLHQQVPSSEIVVSTNTEHGHALAEETFRESRVVYAPLDFFVTVRKALSIVQPDIVVFLETEIWPAWFTEAHRNRIKVAIVNGRISVRSVPSYRRLGRFFREVMGKVDAFSMITEEDASRIVEIGADPEKIEVNGNAKYDLLMKEADPDLGSKARKMLNLRPSQHVFIAGSTREGEEKIVLDVYEKIVKQFSDMVLVIAPRHIVRTPAIESLVKSRGFQYQLRTELKEGGSVRSASVVIMNTFGELFGLYSAGSINFCGASLVPLGGQNPLEAGVWGKVVFYGPHMEDFLDAKALLEKAGAGIEVKNGKDFAEKAIWLLNHPESAGHLGMKAREALLRNQGAAQKHAAVITRLLYQGDPKMTGAGDVRP